ncbi:MAG: DUF5104 domain-containing protein [Eubacterium sp.]|nr:DUF5104 domain-containing protein [Eubacterium sp.]
MIKAKRIFCCLIILMIIPLTAACSISELIETIEDEFFSEPGNSDTETKSVDKIVIEALENHDAEAIKDLFSVRAKNLCTDLDAGIEYMFSIYEGEYVECTHHNSGAQKHYGSDGNTTFVDPVCMFKTTENYYKLTWNQWTVNEKDPEEEGIFSMKLEIWPDAGLNQGGYTLNIAGIVYPDNIYATDMAWNLWKIVYQQDINENHKEVFRDLLSDNTLATGISEDTIESFFEETLPMLYRLGDGWIEYDMNGDIVVYLLANLDTPRYICFGMDKEQPDKISFVKVADVDSDKTIGAFNSAEEAPGIYLPDRT